MFVILTYDVGVKNNARILKICRKYLTHVQKSVFEGNLSEKQLQKIKSELKKWINPENDQIAIYKIRNGLVEKECIGYHIIQDNII